MLSRLAEAEERKLYLREGQPSMYAYCVDHLHWCEGTTSRRIYAARTARRFPQLFVAIAEGRLHLTAVLMLSRYLTSGNVDELVAAATHKSKAEIALLIAERFPRPDVPELLRPMTPTPIQPAATPVEHSPENAHASLLPAESSTPGPARELSPENAAATMAPARLQVPETAHQHSPENAHAAVTPPAVRAVLKPLAPQRFEFQCTFDRETVDLLRDVRDLMGHEVPTGEHALVLKAALKIAKAQLEKRKFSATERPRRSRGCTSPRGIPAEVKRTVKERDGGQCAYVSGSGRRCPSRVVEYDHVEPVARGGTSTVENVRLLCRAHNQHAAETMFGSEFMEGKRAEANRTR